MISCYCCNDSSNDVTIIDSVPMCPLASDAHVYFTRLADDDVFKINYLARLDAAR